MSIDTISTRVIGDPIPESEVALFPTGSIIASAVPFPYQGTLLCDGSALDRLVYWKLFSMICPSLGLATISIASPGVVTRNNHGLITGESLFFTTNGSLPTGLSPNVNYFAIVIDNNTFRLATSYANALAGTAINTSGVQSGTHTLLFAPYGISSPTTFNIPDFRGTFIRGRGVSSGYSQNVTIPMGSKLDDNGQSHGHNVDLSGIMNNAPTFLAGWTGFNFGYDGVRGTTGATSGRWGVETRSKSVGANFYIKF